MPHRLAPMLVMGTGSKNNRQRSADIADNVVVERSNLTQAPFFSHRTMCSTQ